MSVKSLKNLIVFAIFFLVAPVARAEVLVTEVAWMGTAASANDEWIELHNDGSGDVNLSGWTLSAADGTPSINLSGTLGAGEYGLLERTDDTSYPAISALMIFTGALGNEGESLTLKNGGTTVQTLNFSGGWPAGDVTSKDTMQWTGSNWVTAPETAGSATTSSGGENEEEEEDEQEEENEDEETEEEEDEEEVVSTKRNGGSITVKKYPNMLLELEVPTKVVAESPTYFSSQTLDYDRSKLIIGKLVWNMGDGVTRTFSQDFNYERSKGFYHTYEYPGTYILNVKYYRSVLKGAKPDIEEEFTIEVMDSTVVISKTFPDGSIEIDNVSSARIDLSGWHLMDGVGKTFEIPIHTFIAPGKTLVFSGKVTGLSAASSASILTPSKAVVHSLFETSHAPQYLESRTSISFEKDNGVEDAGEVLGASTEDADTESDQKGKNTPGIIWVLLFIILILIAVIAVMLLRRGEKDSEEEYELLDE